jgi:FMN phosphatase YigB (HAD superfamily)
LDLVRTAAVFLDALGTLVELQPPGPRLRRRLAEEGFEVTEDEAAAGFTAEITYYLAHHLEGSDRVRLEDLRDRCATAMMEALALPGLDHATARMVMLDALEFTPYPDALAGVRALHDGGRTVVVVSNWDCSLPDWLDPTGLLAHVDAVVTSADTGVAKPGRGMFEREIEVAGAPPAQAVHVGDSLENDVEGARAFGIRALLLQREGYPPAGVEVVRSLLDVPALL